MANNPDGVPPRPERRGTVSHPYGLTTGHDYQLNAADAGANALLKVDPATGGERRAS